MKYFKMNREFVNPRLKSWVASWAASRVASWAASRAASWAVHALLLLAFLLPLTVLLIPTEAEAGCSRYTHWGQSWCEYFGCYWWNAACRTYPPTCEQPDNQSDCERFGFYWYDGSCHCDEQVTCETITDKPTCQTSGCYWYDGHCNTDAPTCPTLTNQSDCEDYGCYWYDAVCHDVAPPEGPAEGDMPCAVPPFLSETVPPNVLIIMDNSGSMNYPAYVDNSSSNPLEYDYGSYMPDLRYYGYADPDKKYQFATNQFEEITGWAGTADPANQRFSGNFLNWMLSRRIDIARQVLIGGKCESRTFSGRKTLIWEDPAQSYRTYYKYYKCDDGRWWKFKNECDQYVYAYKGQTYQSGSYSYQWKVVKKIQGGEDPHGFVQETFDRCRYGVEHYQESEGGYIAVWLGSPLSSFLTDIENKGCDTWTPLAESFYEATRYYQALSGYYTNANYAAHDPEQGWCQDNFVIMVTDGESTQDLNIPSSLRDYDGDGEDPGSYASSGSDYLDDVALWAHTADMRDDYESEQHITLYTVYCFGQEEDARGILKRAAKNGAFKDKNDNNIPDLDEEWDKDGDGVPDGYYEAANGWQLKNSLNAIVMDILRQTSAAAAVSVVSTSDKGEGNVFQAYFSPKLNLSGSELEWIGELHALWIDQLGNLREDSDADGHLHLKDDRILHIYFDTDQNQTVVERWEDTDGDCEEDVLEDEVGMNDISSVWRAGRKLWNTSVNDRNIKVVVPKVSESGFELIDFKKGPAHTPRIAPHLNYGTTAMAESLINYIKGIDYDDIILWRSRTADSKVWKLSDIVSSSPTFVGAPADRYDLIFNDASYRSFFQKYKTRQGMVYVGANDGMLHMFNAGRYVETGSPLDRGYLDDMGDDLGTELEAIIPFNLLPHLKWLSSNDYCHVYYVDLKPKVFDAKIFIDDARHPNGWGTALICGMRFGGTEYTIPDFNTYSSAYFALDITDPDHIELMWETTDPDIAFTTNYPGVIKVGNKWFLIAGSGPTSVGGGVSQTAELFIANITDLTDSKKFYSTSSYDGHFADAIPVDVDIDGNVDAIYIGESYWHGSSWYGKIYKVLTHESEDLADWTMSEFMSVPGPITAGGAATIDDAGRLWVYFGTGRYYSDLDEGDKADQYFFGAKDPDWNAASSVTFTDLIDITNVTVQQTESGTYVYEYESDTIGYDSLLVDMASGAGWRMTMVDGERITNHPLIIGGVVFFTSYIPNDDICSFGGSSRLYGVDYRTGVPGETSILGMDEDGWLYEFVEIGEGVPSSPAVHVGLTDDAMIAVQLSTGAISQTSASINSPKSKGLFWRGK